jgi:adenine-specific DNA methylase
MNYPKRLIEVDLPIKRISEHSRREKSSGQKHISTLHIWWARRPLAACRAVICAALWPDPADPLCPNSFRNTVRIWMKKWATEYIQLLGKESIKRFIGFQKNPKRLEDNKELRWALLDFIADTASWENCNKKEYLETSRAITQAAHEALGGTSGMRPLVVDPFAGGGAIPLEAIRIGADAFSSDLNPVAVLLNKVVLEYLPKYRQQLLDEVRKWGDWVKKETEEKMNPFYPKGSDGTTPIAYLWARTIHCEGPGCGAEIPLIRSLWLAKTGHHSVALRLIPDHKKKHIDIEIQKDAKDRDVGEGTVRRGTATCPICGYTTPAGNVRNQFHQRKGGATDARLTAVVATKEAVSGRIYRIPTVSDYAAIKLASERVQYLNENLTPEGLPIFPSEPLPYLRSIFNVYLLGIEKWKDLFNNRQLLSIHYLRETIRRISSLVDASNLNETRRLREAVITVLALVLDKIIDSNSSLCRWRPTSQDIGNTFGRQALGIVWDFAEINIFSGSTRDWDHSIEGCINAMLVASDTVGVGTAQQFSADQNPLPSDFAGLIFTDPPYYDSVPYANLSDFFYVWLKRTLSKIHSDLFLDELSPKENEIVQLSERNKIYAFKTRENYEKLMTKALSETGRILSPNGIGVVVFAHKQTDAWEAQIQSMVDAGWTITASWPIDTEKGSRLRAIDSAALASSIHLVCRPRKHSDGSSQTENIGEWREILAELPKRIHEWMPRLSAEGIVGADAIFACLGPALEIFSRYSRVEKASGEEVTLKEYLEYVWAAVAKEALNMIFEGVDATGFEEDARLTAMWLWTLSTGNNGNGKGKSSKDDEEVDDEDESKKTKQAIGGYALEYDAARKIAQGLGAHLEKLNMVVEVKGDTARLLPVSERTRYLFGKDEASSPAAKRKKKEPQLKLGFIKEIEDIETKEGWGAKSSPKAGSTVLDRIHQSMILFAAGRSEALKRFLVEEGAGNDQRFWRLAQALSALYPKNSDEKRWVDGVLARKKGLGF